MKNNNRKKYMKNKKRVVVAMSGGVDSSVAAALMVEKGYEVIGLTMQLYDENNKKSVNSKSCCAGQDIYDAKNVAEKLGIDHYVLNYETRFFKNVIKDFADTYAEGKTPIPCIRCNERVKFRDLFNTAMGLEAEILVTGHYANIKNNKSGISLHKAYDKDKDQSYFLFATPIDVLEKIAFPLGNMHKSSTREYAKKMDLPVLDKPESQDICFVQSNKKGGYREIVQKLRPDASLSGDIVHVNGSILGKHNGIDGFTIGQRRGLGVNSTTGNPLYVTKIDPKKKIIFVGEENDLLVNKFRAVDMTWLSKISVGSEFPATVKIRSQHDPVKAKIYVEDEKKVVISFEKPCPGVAPGQASVIYNSDQVIGGGWILENLN